MITFTHDSEAFADRAEGFLSARLERNLLATILLGARQGHFGDTTPLFAVIADVDEEPLAVMLRTPPMPAIVTGLDHPAVASDPAQVTALLDGWLEHDPHLPGINGEPSSARPVAAAWAARTGGATAVRVSEAMHALTAVTDPPRPAAGELRSATPEDRDLLIRWERDFMAESHASSPANVESRVERRIANGRQFIWADAGSPVSTVGCNAMVAGTQRIGPVYTPPEHRNRGYGTSATAETSRRLLAAGAERCMLFTDLANPTSNAIYAAIGYRRFADFEEHVLIPPAG